MPLVALQLVVVSVRVGIQGALLAMAARSMDIYKFTLVQCTLVGVLDWLLVPAPGRRVEPSRGITGNILGPISPRPGEIN